MPADTPFMVVQGPRFTPLRYGLLSAAEIVNDPDPHWQNGAQFQPDACGGANSVTSFCVAGGPATGTPTKVPTATGAGSSAAEPFTVYAFMECAPPGWGDNLEDFVARATRQLDAGEGRAVEQVLWTGTPTGGAVVRPHLAEDTAVFATPQGASTVELQSAATLVTAAAVDIVAAMAGLEGALGECYGGEGIIHVPRSALPHLADRTQLVVDGPKLRTVGGTLIAAYASNNREGPTGSEAAAGQAWFYATGAVMARRSPAKPLGMRPADFVNREDNTVGYVVERTFAIDWDCCHFAAQVTLPGAA